MNLPELPQAYFWGSSGRFCGTKAHADSVCESPSGPVPVWTEGQMRAFYAEGFRAGMERAAQIAQEEALEEPLDTAPDVAYNMAVEHIAAAIRAETE